jgi:uncharacterized protein YgfB (UPF0149 family)
MAKKIPNPNGKKGSEGHQNKVKEVIARFDPTLYTTAREYLVRTPDGKKKKRFVDVAALKGKKPAFLVQVGKTKSDGSPVKREQEAMDDIEQAIQVKVQFEDYEK